jgi:hypothetical protein
MNCWAKKSNAPLAAIPLTPRKLNRRAKLQRWNRNRSPKCLPGDQERVLPRKLTRKIAHVGALGATKTRRTRILSRAAGGLQPVMRMRIMTMNLDRGAGETGQMPRPW